MTALFKILAVSTEWNHCWVGENSMIMSPYKIVQTGKIIGDSCYTCYYLLHLLKGCSNKAHKMLWYAIIFAIVWYIGSAVEWNSGLCVRHKCDTLIYWITFTVYTNELTTTEQHLIRCRETKLATIPKLVVNHHECHILSGHLANIVWNSKLGKGPPN